jgi:hypothetical protein
MPNTLITEVNVARDLSTLTKEDWGAQMRWYTDETSKDSYVKGTFWFGWGSLGGAWEEFDILHNGFAETWYDIVISTASSIPPIPSPVMGVVPYSQNDPRWAADRMRPSPYTLGAAGCAVVATTMKATLLYPTLTPKIMNEWLSNNSGYLFDGRLKWSKPAEFIPGMEFREYFVWPGGADLALLYSLIEESPTVVKVDFYPGAPIESHFVLGLARVGNDLRILDPWTGTERMLLEAYGPGKPLAEAVLAAVEYRLDPAPVPPNPPSGRGVHGPPTCNPPANTAALIARLQGMGIEWYKMLHSGQQENYALLEALMTAGIQPVVRIYDDHQFPDRNAVLANNPDAVRGVIDTILSFNLGNGTSFCPYLELANEPNLGVEWQQDKLSMVDWHKEESIAVVGDSIWADIETVVGMGGNPAFPAFAHTDRGGTNARYSGLMWGTGVFEHIFDGHTAEVLNWFGQGLLWVADHAAAMARPFDFNPYRPNGIVDDMCLLGYLPLLKFVEGLIAQKAPILLTEGGVFSPAHMSQLGWDDCVRDGVVYYEGTNEVFYDETTWGMRVREALDLLPMPVMGWHLKDIGNEWDGGGWYDINWNPRSPVAALTE